MAYRKNVGRLGWQAMVVALLAGLLAGCSDSAPPQPTVKRGQVIDQDTEKPIPGVIVVGTYEGSRGFEGASSCNRVESAVSDEDGWFTLPLDPNAGPVLLSGDAVHFQENWENRRVPARNFNKEQSLASMQKLADILKREHATLWINHDKAQTDTLRHAPAFFE